MLIDSIVNFYKKEVSSYALVFKYCKWIYRIFVLSTYLFTLSFVPIIITFSINKYKVLGVIITILFILFAGIMMLILNANAKIIETKYSIVSDEWSWYCEAFNSMQEEIFNEYLNKKALFTDKKIKHLTQLLKDEANRNKLPPLIAPGILLAFSIPVWVQFISVIYKTLGTIELATTVTIVIFCVIVVLAECIGICKIIYNDTICPIINRRSYLIEKTLYMVNITVLRLPDEVR